MKAKIVLIIAAAAALGACASNPNMGTSYRPVVDLQSRSPELYEKDLGECQALARQRDDAARNAMAGAIAGALLGAIIAPRDYRQNLANRGALLGGLGAAGQAVETQETIIKRCLSGRGYSVLN